MSFEAGKPENGLPKDLGFSANRDTPLPIEFTDAKESAAVAGAEELKVTFFPPLQAARCAWILRTLRRERVTSVLDVGCGEGALLRCLCVPSAFLNRPNGTGAHEALESESESEPSVSRAGILNNDPPDLHIARLAGLDVSRPDLELCAEAIAPRAESDSGSSDYCLGLPRWELLEVTLWYGSLGVYNTAFVGTECIVATEVIEHLPTATLSSFARTLLGQYRPRLLLLTTPNHNYNARFSAPGAPDPLGYPDPTRRTSRVFRHHDHQFEWTRAEFAAWCADAARAWGYTVELDGVGVAMEDDPWGREAELGYATQVALFRRNDNLQAPEAALLPESQQTDKEESHTLLKTHSHSPHPKACKPQELGSIQDLIIKHMKLYYPNEGYSVWDLWVADEISTACGGYLDVLLRAIEVSLEISLEKIPVSAATEWKVKFSGEKHCEAVETQKKERIWDKPETSERIWSPPVVEEHSSGWADRRAGWPQPQKTDHLTESETNVDIVGSSWGYTEAQWGGWG